MIKYIVISQCCLRSMCPTLAVILFVLLYSCSALPKYDEYIDRQYMNDNMANVINRLMGPGPDSVLLEVGYEERLNNKDYIRFNITTSQCYFVDPSIVSTGMTQFGYHIKGNLSSMGYLREFKHRFRVLADVGVLGFQPHRWKTHDIYSHIESYSRLMEYKGTLIFHMSILWPPKQLHYWSLIKDRMEKCLEFKHAHVLISNLCNAQDNQRVHHFYKTFNSLKVSIDNTTYAGRKCESFMFSMWENHNFS